MYATFPGKDRAYANLFWSSGPPPFRGTDHHTAIEPLTRIETKFKKRFMLCVYVMCICYVYML